VQYSKERYLQYKELTQTVNRNQDLLFQENIVGELGNKKKGTAQKRERTFLEKMVLFLLLLFLVSGVVAFALKNTDIMVYDGIVNFLALGFVTAIKPQMVVGLMQKNNPRFEQIYGNKIKGLTLGIRLFGLFFLAMGLYFIYALVI